MPPPEGEDLPGYVAWLPDRTVTLYRDAMSWHRERLRVFGDTPSHRAVLGPAGPPRERLLEGQP